MAITQAIPNSFRGELLTGTHNFTATTGNVFKLALYTSASVMSSATTSFSTTAEVANTGQYVGALIYNTSSSNKAVAVLSFGGDKTATAGTFTIQFPAATTSAAILTIS